MRPVRASGTRWVSHKVEAMKRVLSKFGAYTSHLVALSEDTNVRDRTKLKGFVTKWTDAKYLWDVQYLLMSSHLVLFCPR